MTRFSIGPGRLIRVLPLLFVGLALNSCTTDNPSNDLRSFLRGDIADQDRSQELLLLSEKLEIQLNALAADLKDYDFRIRRLNADYDTEESELSALFSEAEDMRASHRDEILTTFLEMRSIATEEEWETLSKLQIEWAVLTIRPSSPL